MVASVDGLADEVAGQTDDGDEADGLQGAHDRVGDAQGAEGRRGRHLLERGGCDQAESRARGALGSLQRQVLGVEWDGGRGRGWRLNLAVCFRSCPSKRKLGAVWKEMRACLYLVARPFVKERLKGEGEEW